MNGLRSKFGSLRKHIYQKVDNEAMLSLKEGENGFESYSDRDTEDVTRSSPLLGRKHRTLTSSALLFFMALSIFFAGAYLLKKPTDIECGIQTGIYSPANEAIEYLEIDFVNPFAHDTIYRDGGVRITDDKLPYLNRTPDLGSGKHLRPVEDEEGGYHALLEVFHQLHCLNLIRQYTWRDWYGRHEDIVRTPGDLRDNAVGSRMHVDHCIEALRLSLMCHGDTTPYMIMLDPTAPQRMRADFSPHHKCRNFNKLRDWAKENQLAAPPPMHWEGKQVEAHYHQGA